MHYNILSISDPMSASFIPPSSISSSSATSVIPVRQTLPSSVRIAHGFPSEAYLDLLHQSNESFTPSRSSQRSVSSTLSRSSLSIPQPRPYQTYKPSSQTKPKLSTPLIPHKNYRTIQSLQPTVNTTAMYNHTVAGISESNV